MEIIRTVNRLAQVVDAARRDGRTIGLVPTMGALHAGHKSLVDRARRENDVVVVSVFVNPTQFNNADDLRTYPRTEEADCAMLESCGADYAFVPTPDEVYPEPDNRVFDLGPVAEVMEGAMRPGHFNGVAQIVSKLFAWAKPTRAYFGEKDFQQIAVIRRMAELEGFDLEIVPCPIVREADGPGPEFAQCTPQPRGPRHRAAHTPHTRRQRRPQAPGLRSRPGRETDPRRYQQHRRPRGRILQHRRCAHHAAHKPLGRCRRPRCRRLRHRLLRRRATD